MAGVYPKYVTRIWRAHFSQGDPIKAATKGRIQRPARGGTMGSVSNPANIPICVLFVMDHTKKLIVLNSREGELYAPKGLFGSGMMNGSYMFTN